MTLLTVPDFVPTDGADVILGLGAGLHPDGTPSLPTQAVAQRVVRLYAKNCAPLVLLSGGFTQRGVSEARAMASVLFSQGITEDILLDESPDHTRGTHRQPVSAARVLASALPGRPWRIVLVAHPLHLRRARWLFVRGMPESQFFVANAAEAYDRKCAQRRLHSRSHFRAWTLIAWMHHFLFLRAGH